MKTKKKTKTVKTVKTTKKNHKWRALAAGNKCVHCGLETRYKRVTADDGKMRTPTFWRERGCLFGKLERGESMPGCTGPAR